MTPRRFTGLSDDALRFVNAECEAFEKAIVSGQPARIEDRLESAPADLREALFCELLTIEVEYRNSSGDSPNIAEYQQRFADLEEQIIRAFDRASLMETDLISPKDLDASQYSGATGDDDVETAIRNRGDLVRYIGDYEILEVLGKGGMGVVYAARQVSLNRAVAIKMIKPGLLDHDDGVRRFRNEADAVALLDHPGIVPIYEVGDHEGQHYFSMKLIEGGSLAPQLKNYAKDPRLVARVIAKTASAVAHAHTRGILHRDLKPANILIDHEGQPHVTDFGLAKRVEELPGAELTQTGQILGTPAYMSPEQASGRRGGISTASDVYGLGAVLYAMLTGKAPFGGDSVVETLDAVRNQPPVAPRRVNNETPHDLETITLRCLEKDPRRRYPTAQALADDLNAWLDHRPISARRVGSLERAWLWCKRRPAVAALSAATLIAIIVGTASVIAVQAASNRELATEVAATKRAEERAEKQLDRAMESIKDYYSGFSQDAITSEQIPLAVREQLLEKPREFYEGLTQGLAANNAATPRELRLLAAGKLSLGEIFLILGRHDEARVQTDAAIAQFEALVEVSGADPVASRAGLATCYNQLSDILLGTGDTAAARAPLNKSIILSESLIEEEPNESGLRNLLAQAHSDMGNLMQAVGEVPAAQVSHEKAIAQYTILTKADPTEAAYLQGLAISYGNLGLALNARSDWTAAQNAYGKAIETQKKLVAAHPNKASYLDSLASSYTNLGLLLHSKAKYPTARTRHQEAVEIYETLVTRHPGIPEYLDGLAGGYTNLGRAFTYTGETEAATDANRNAVHRYTMLVASRPNVATYQDGLARSHVNLGAALKDQNQIAAATEAYLEGIAIGKSLAAGHPDVPEYQYLLAVTNGNLAEIQQHNGDLTAAKQAYIDAIAVLDILVKDHPDDPNYQYALSVFRFNLGQLLQEQGDAKGALEEFQLSLKNAIEGTPVANELPKTIRDAEAELAALDRLPAVLLGTQEPRDTAERMTFARLCGRRSQYAAAVEFWQQAFKDDPTLTQDRDADHRFDAACAAAMAAAGHDKNSPPPDEAEQSRLRDLALGWLTIKLDDWTEFLPTVPQEARPGIIKNLSFWQAEKDLQSVHNPDALPKTERQQWQAFWDKYHRVLRTDITVP